VRLALAIAGSAVLAAATLAAAAAGAPATATVHVTPASGGPRTVFSVSFRAATRTGVVGTLRRVDTLSVARRGGGAAGCVANAEITLPAAATGEAVRVRLDPRTLDASLPGASWCVAAYTGQIQETGRPVCTAGHACPQFIVALGTVGRFHFTVHTPG
jgi:hypothetical protein